MGCFAGKECLSGTCQLFTCQQPCTTHDDCDHLWFCNDNDHLCHPQKDIGGFCLLDVECLSGKCADTSFGGNCGECKNDNDCDQYTFCKNNLTSTECAARLFLGAACTRPEQCYSNACYTLKCSECDSQDDCDADEFCTLEPTPFTSECQPDKANFESCLGDHQCISGNCYSQMCVICDEQSDCDATTWCKLDVLNPDLIDCVPRKANGEGCTFEYECLSDQCTLATCVTACDVDADCSDDASAVCDPTFKFCKDKLANGGVCLNDNICQSGNCWFETCSECNAHGDCAADEYCTLDVLPPIESVCAAQKADGEPCASPIECLGGLCPALTFKCAECEFHGDCPTDEHCNLLGSCVADLPNNAVCTGVGDEGCATGHCLDRYCAECDGDGDCPASQHCNAANDCANDVGNNAVCLRPSFCTSGICSAGLCAECLSAADCDAGEFCNLGGDCQAKLANDTGVCASDNECVSGHCQGAPLGTCRECTSHSHCSADKHCNLHVGGNFRCAADLANDQTNCQASDAYCQSGICDTTTCRECVSFPAQEGCSSSQYCSNYDCVAKKGEDGICASDAECKSGLDCVFIAGEGNSQCRYPCSSQSTCTSITPTGTRWCNGSVCFDKFDNGYITCGSNVECKSGHCDGGMCVECTQDSHCGSSKPYCRVRVGAENYCVECKNNSYCNANEYCSDSAFTCQPDKAYGASCVFSGECTDQGPYSLDETCCVIRAGGNYCENLDFGQYCAAVE